MTGLRVIVRTPHGVVVDEPVRSARVPTTTGQVGLRPRGEPLSLVVESGLLVLRTHGPAVRFVSTAGGLLEADRARCTIFTPFAATGDDDDEVLAALERALAAPSGELVARRRLGELERRIANELTGHPKVRRARSAHG